MDQNDFALEGGSGKCSAVELGAGDFERLVKLRLAGGEVGGFLSGLGPATLNLVHSPAEGDGKDGGNDESDPEAHVWIVADLARVVHIMGATQRCIDFADLAQILVSRA